MIPLFKIYKPIIDYSKFTHNLHDRIVTDFENSFAKYMGVKYAIAVDSCTTAIYLTIKWVQWHYGTCQSANIPTMIPPVVLNALYHADSTICFNDDIKWVGSHYYLKKDSVFAVIDSAHEIDKNQVAKFDKSVKGQLNPDKRWAALYSFYPTKPVAGLDGGMIITNNDIFNTWLRTAIMNGTSTGDSWERQIEFPGWKAYMNTFQACAAYQQFARIDKKKLNLKEIRDYYNKKLKLKNTSDHLYRIKVKNNIEFIDKMKKNDIQCGIHYRCTHKEDAYKGHTVNCDGLSKSERASNKTVSIPFHEDITIEMADHIIKKVEECRQ